MECSAPDNLLENTPVYVPESWVNPEPDRNDGNCEEPNDCLGTVAIHSLPSNSTQL